MAMLPSQRRWQIAQDVEADGACTISALSRRYGVSEMTIRRDLRLLRDEGRVELTHGGATRFPRSPHTEPFYAAKRRVHAARKDAIARYAAEQFVRDGDVIILEGGTTVTGMAAHLSGRGLTVVTNGLHTLVELQRLSARASVVCCGGVLREGAGTFVGPHAEHFFHEFHANTLFLSATGLTLEAGLTDPNMIETQVKKAMVQSAARVVVLADGSKFGVRSLTTVLHLADAAALVTDAGAPADALEAIRALGVSVHVAPATADAPRAALVP